MSDQALPTIGISARYLSPQPEQGGVRTKTLDYVERSVSEWIGSGGALPVALPPCLISERSADAVARRQAEICDGLVLQGGIDVSPTSYGQSAISEQWMGDTEHDAYERRLLEAFIALGKPVLGICRGAQLINVHFGGSLWQDIPSQCRGSAVHRDAERYDRHFHAIRLEPGSALAALHGGETRHIVNSIHHQAIRRLGRDLTVEARSEADGLVEAVRWGGPSHVVGVQWHPEFGGQEGAQLMSSQPLLSEFLAVAMTVSRARKFVRDTTHA